MSGLSKFFTKERTMVLVVFLLVSLFILSYSSSKVFDGFETKAKPAQKKENKPVEKKGTPPPKAPSGAPPVKKEPTKEGFTTKKVNNPNELLPHDANKEWETYNPMTHNNPQSSGLLSAGHHIGLDTVGQTMKNANLQLRSDPVIEKKSIGPWNQSTIEPDMQRVPLEVGSVH